MEKKLKNYNKILWTFIAYNITIFISLYSYSKFNLTNLNNIYSVILESSIVMSTSIVITIVLNNLITSDFKAKIVFWKIKDPLPGCRIFTKLINKDNRIDIELLKEKYGELPKKPSEQNKLWYRIYTKHRFDKMVFETHREFLISRDLTGLSFIFLGLFSIISIIFFKSNYKISIYIVYLLIQYTLISIYSQNRGNRFAKNVLAIESTLINK